MNDRLITIADLDRWGACGRDHRYSDRRLKRLLRGRPGWTPMDVARSRSVPYKDRVWVLLREEVLGKAGLRRVVEMIVTRTVRTHALHCGIAEVEQWAWNWLSGEDRSLLAAEAAAEVSFAAEAAAAAAAAEEELAWAAAAAAAAAAAFASATRMAEVAAAEHRIQLQDIVTVLREEVNGA